jgi:hypothetical protein
MANASTFGDVKRMHSSSPGYLLTHQHCRGLDAFKGVKRTLSQNTYSTRIPSYTPKPFLSPIACSPVSRGTRSTSVRSCAKGTISPMIDPSAQGQAPTSVPASSIERGARVSSVKRSKRRASNAECRASGVPTSSAKHQRRASRGQAW